MNSPTKKKKNIKSQKCKYKVQLLDTIYHHRLQNNQKLPLSTKNLYRLHKCYSPFLWRNAKGQLESIIKRRSRRGSSKMHQLGMKSTNLTKQVHQNLSMSRLNGQDMIQRTSNVWIIRSNRWRNISITNGSTRCLSLCNTCRRGRRGYSTRRLNSKTRRAMNSPLPKESGTYGTSNVYGLKRGETI